MLLVVSLHWFGTLKDFYYLTNWYDFPMHFLGGAWVALFSLWAVSTQYGTFFKKYISIKSLILWTLAVGIAWEFLEIGLHFNNIHDIGYAWDTTHDLIMDVVGASVVAAIYKKAIRNNL
jgi:hypothetical protein